MRSSRLGLFGRSVVAAAGAVLIVGLIAGPTLAAKALSNGSRWSSATAISPTLQPDPTRGSQLNDVAVNASGQAIAAWDQYTYDSGGGATIGAAVQSGRGWAAPFTISGTSGFSTAPKVAIGADGTMAVSWTAQDPASGTSPQQRIQVAVKPAGSSTWTTTTLAQGPLGGVSVTEFVPLGVDAKGDVTAAWTLWNGSHNVMQAATKLAGQPWSANVALAPGVDAIFPALDVNPAGRAAVVFAATPYPGTAMTNVAKAVLLSGPTGTWSAPVDVSETISSSVGYVSSPQVALDANGLATVVYMGSGVESTRQLAGGTWTTPASVIPAPNAVSSFTSSDLGLDANGNAVVAASVFDATINVDRASIWVSRGTPNGTWGTPVRITDPSVPVDAYASSVAVSPDGTLAVVGWIDHFHGTVEASRLVSGTWAGPTTIGRGTAFSSFQETLVLDAGSGTVARAIWKHVKSGIVVTAADYRG
jgi:hypothetical protein